MFLCCSSVDLCTQQQQLADIVPRKKESNFPPINISVAASKAERLASWQAEMRTKVFCKVSEAA